VATTKLREDEWLRELAALSQKHGEGLTAEEWAEKLGRGVHYARQFLKKASSLGWLREDKRTARALGGRPYLANVYRIVKPGKS
jgi:hypothetical protein